MKILLAFLIFTFPGFAFARVESRCFQNDTLQGKNSVAFDTNGDKVSGTFSVDKGDENAAKTYEFTGIRAGNILSVKFDRIKFPDVAPSEMKSLNWTLVKVGDQEVLRIKFYGKNYETNKYADYFADFESCEPNYKTLAKKAKIVQFAKGKNSETAPISFKDINERKVFSINIRRGQSIEIEAANCKIAIYQPNQKLYDFVEWENEDGSQKTFTSAKIDRVIIKPIPQTGNYLVVLQKIVEDAQSKTVTFKITN